jgi:hypothetical protein
MVIAAKVLFKEKRQLTFTDGRILSFINHSFKGLQAITAAAQKLLN